MRHGEKCGAEPDGREGPQHGGGQRRSRRKPGCVVAQRAQSRPGRQPAPPRRGETARPRRRRAAPDTGGAMAAASRTASNPVPSRPAGSSRTPASVAGLGAAASAETDLVAGGNGAPAIACSNAARARRLERLPRQQGEALGPQRDTVGQAVGDASLLLSAQPTGGSGRRLTRAAVAEPTPSWSRRSRRKRGRSAVASMFEGSSTHATPADLNVARNRAGGTASSGRSRRSVLVSTSGAMPAMPAGPLPPSARICRVSA